MSAHSSNTEHTVIRVELQKEEVEGSGYDVVAKFKKKGFWGLRLSNLNMA